jgi:hypothetical protein
MSFFIIPFSIRRAEQKRMTREERKKDEIAESIIRQININGFGSFFGGGFVCLFCKIERVFGVILGDLN